MSRECDRCGQVYYTEDHVPSPEYMEHGHILFECPNPDLMERAYLNASPQEREEVW